MSRSTQKKSSARRPSRAKSSTSKSRAMEWFVIRAEDSPLAKALAANDRKSNLSASVAASGTLELFMAGASPGASELITWLRQVHDYVDELRRLIHRIRRAAGPRWNVEADARRMLALGIVNETPHPGEELELRLRTTPGETIPLPQLGIPWHWAPQQGALFALLDSIERLGKAWVILDDHAHVRRPSAPKGRRKTAEQAQRERELVALVRWAGRAPADVALAAIALGVEPPCDDARDFAARTKVWAAMIRRRR